jgi:hypothetical protein
MTILFHRLQVPTYFGGLPAGYDYINNAISGTPANADGQKTSGPNAGSYFVCFGEDATSSDANRPNMALAANTDYLDNLLHQDLAVNVRTADVTPGSPVPSVTITGPGIFIGNVGDTLNDCFHVTDLSDADLLVSGVQLVVASISGGTLGGGFSTGSITLTFNVSIPASQGYRIWYGQRSNLATLPANAFTTLRIRSAVQVSEQVEAVLAALHGNGEAWNAAWDNTIYGLNQDILAIQTVLANLHGNSEAWNHAWDRTIYDLNQFAISAPAVNWPNLGNNTHNIQRGAWSFVDQMWFAVGDGGTSFCEQSRDFGNTWDDLTSTISAGVPLTDVTVGSTGNVVIMAVGNVSVVGTRTAYNTFSWASHVSPFSHTVAAGRLGFDSSASKYIAVYRSGSAGIFVDTSSDGVTWTNQTVPSAWSSYSGTTASPRIHVIAGVAIAVFNDGTNVNVMVSTNGGVSWTNSTLPFAVTSTTVPTSPTYDYTTQTWFVLVSDSSTNQSQVFFSTNNGGSWLAFGPMLSNPNNFFESIAALPYALVAVTSHNQIYLAPNVTSFIQWTLVANNAQTNTTTLEMREGGGGLMVWNSADRKSWSTIRSGSPIAAEWGPPPS